MARESVPVNAATEYAAVESNDHVNFETICNTPFCHIEYNSRSGLSPRHIKRTERRLHSIKAMKQATNFISEQSKTQRKRIFY